jgi:hypothetical protein
MNSLKLLNFEDNSEDNGFGHMFQILILVHSCIFHWSGVSCFVNNMYSETHLIIPFISTWIWPFAVALWTK